MEMFEVYDLHKKVMGEIGVTRKNCELHLAQLVKTKFLVIGDDGTLFFTMPETGNVVGIIRPS